MSKADTQESVDIARGKIINQEKGIRKIEFLEDDFLLFVDIKRPVDFLLDKMNQVLSRHTIRDLGWKGQIVPFEVRKKQ